MTKSTHPQRDNSAPAGNIRPTEVSVWSLALGLTLLLTLGNAFGQDGPAASEDEDPSRETDVSEDNYRRFMELNDIRLERPAFPTPSAPAGTGLQKLDQLPESSQKHLRNQLRGIILSGVEWTPGEREKDYPFVPSAAARQDGELLRQEAEAWAELVQEYHDREAAILAGATMTGSAGTGSASGGAPSSAASVGGARSPGQPSSQNQGQNPGENPGENQGQSQSQAQSQAQTQAQGQSQEQSPGSSSGNAQAQAENQGQGQGQGEGQNQGEGQDGEQGEGNPSDRTAQSTERPRSQQSPSLVDPSEPPPLPEDPLANAGVEQSAAAYLRARGLSEENSDGISSASRAEIDASEPGRWGEAAQTLLPPPEVNTQTSGADVAEANTMAQENTPAGRPNTLTLDELEQVRGVSVRLGSDPSESPGEGSTIRPAEQPSEGDGAEPGTESGEEQAEEPLETPEDLPPETPAAPDTP